MQMNSPQPIWDVLIVGGGISGIASLTAAREAGLTALLLEKQEGFGGLWRTLPRWQDIQTATSDWGFGANYARGPYQGQIVSMMEELASQQDLMKSVLFGTVVTSLSFDEDQRIWRVETPGQVHMARHVCLSSGAHNTPTVPNLRVNDESIRQVHSSGLREEGDLEGKRVVIIGAGASALDMVVLCLKNDVKSLDWVFREPRYFSFLEEGKHSYKLLRYMALHAIRSKRFGRVNKFLKKYFDGKFLELGLPELRPDYDYDVSQHTLVSSRPEVVKNAEFIDFHRGDEIVEIENGVARTRLGKAIEADLIVYATGFEMDLSYTGLDKIAQFKSPEDVAKRTYGYCKSKDYPSLYYIAFPYLDGNSTTPFCAKLMARTAMADIKGVIQIPETVFPCHLVHWSFLHRFASFDRFHFPRFRWRLHWFLLARKMLKNPRLVAPSLRYGDRFPKVGALSTIGESGPSPSKEREPQVA